MSANVNFDWAPDGLSVVMSNKERGKNQKVTMSWNSLDEVPSEEKLRNIYSDYFDSVSAHSESYAKVVDLPFNKQLSLGLVKSAKEFDEALFRVGKLDISFPISKDNKLILKAPKFKKTDKFGFGAGNASNAAWMEIKDKKNNGE